MGKWYFTKKEIRNSPSVQRGLPLETELRYRREGIQHMMDLKNRLGFSTAAMATGAIYFHRFYMFRTFQDFPRHVMACTCVFLAGKVEETPKKCRDLVMCEMEILPRERFLQQFGIDLKSVMERLMILEKILLQTVKFHLEFEHPYSFVVTYSNTLTGKGKDENRELKHIKMQKLAWRLLDDSWCTTLCLQWEPEIIAIGAIYLACKLTKFKVVTWAGRTETQNCWWEPFVQDLSTDVLDYICHDFLDHYSVPKPPKPEEISPLFCPPPVQVEFRVPDPPATKPSKPAAYSTPSHRKPYHRSRVTVPTPPPPPRLSDRSYRPRHRRIDVSSSKHK